MNKICSSCIKRVGESLKCPSCNGFSIKYGFSNAGKQRYYCRNCLKSFIHFYTRLSYRPKTLSDHLGNVLATVLDRKTGATATGEAPVPGGLYDHWHADIAQASDYYPGGMMMPGRNTEYSWSRMGYNGQAKDDEVYGKGNLNTALFWEMDTRIVRRWNVDPVMKSWESSYAVFGGNPIMYNDVLGDDWFKDKNGKSKFDPKVQDQKSLKPGQTYIGKEFKERTSKGTADFRKDGSIMYSNETDAYNRMQSASEEPNGGTTKHEVMSVIKKDGVLVLPDYKNNSTTSEVEEYGYKWANGKIYDPVTKTSQAFLGTIHVHPVDMQDGGASASPGLADISYFTSQTPNKPFMTMGYDGKIHTAIGDKNRWSGVPMPKGYSTVKDIQNGASLIKLLQSMKPIK